ncbi:hypothetical protein Tco_0866162 [Tanacetum coccineum]
MGSPGIEVPVFEVPPSPDYVPGPEEPEQAPPSPIYIPFVPELVYLEFLPVDDKVFLAEEQPLPAADSPTHQSPGYIPESDPEDDLEEDDEEDPEEDPADYPADRGDDDDAEDEHLAPAEPAAVAYSADQDPYIAYPAEPAAVAYSARMSIRTQAPAPFLSEEVTKRVLALPTPPPSPLSPYSSPLPQIPSPPLPIPPPTTNPLTLLILRIPEMVVTRARYRKRPCRTTPGPGCEVGESSAAGAARQFGPTTAEADLMDYVMLEALQTTRCPRELGNGLDSDRPFPRRTFPLTDSGGGQIIRVPHGHGPYGYLRFRYISERCMSLRTTVVTQQSEIVELRAADQRRQTVISELLKADYRRQRQLAETLKIVKSLKAQMTELQRQQGPAKDPAEPELPEEAGSSS